MVDCMWSMHCPHMRPRVPRAYIEVDVVRETTKSELFAEGAWPKVIDYVQRSAESKGKGLSSALFEARKTQKHCLLCS